MMLIKLDILWIININTIIILSGTLPVSPMPLLFYYHFPPAAAVTGSSSLADFDLPLQSAFSHAW